MRCSARREGTRGEGQLICSAPCSVYCLVRVLSLLCSNAYTTLTKMNEGKDNLKRIFFLEMTFTGMCTFYRSSTIVGSHFENFVSEKRIFEAKTVKCVYPTKVTIIREKFDEPDPEIDKPDEPLQYLSDSIGQQQARLIGNVGVSPVSLSPQDFPK